MEGEKGELAERQDPKALSSARRRLAWRLAGPWGEVWVAGGWEEPGRQRGQWLLCHGHPARREKVRGGAALFGT